jgi:hypothetical protein
MRIIVCVRTLNEAERIEKFCHSYPFADKILIADGGSEDRTVEIAWKQPRTFVRDYLLKVECKNGIWRNPDGLHLQFLFDWAVDEGADWIISQDCDQRPNKILKNVIRDVLSKTDMDFITATQVFRWGKDQYFPAFSTKNGNMYLEDANKEKWYQGMWAWRANIGLKVVDAMPHYFFNFDGSKNMLDIDKTGRCFRIYPPACFMHYGWITPEMTEAHMEYYRKSGLIPGQLHPLQMCGAPAPLLDWMVE